jgi:2-oxoglutarate ferredoxin oxidoreductase subunit beta
MMKTVFERTSTLKDVVTHYCPGCGHGVAHRLIAEVIDELGIHNRTIGIAPVGCAVLAYDYLDVDMIEVAHGRAPAVATGMKRTNQDMIVFSYQGDGDLASIGAAEIVHAAHRGEHLTVIFINNAVYGMTGGQMAPTTMLDQVTTTSPAGRSEKIQGFPLQVAEMLSVLPGTIYIERTAMFSPAQVDDAPGLAMVEVLSACPTYWRMSPVKAMQWIENEMTKVYPLGKLKG